MSDDDADSETNSVIFPRKLIRKFIQLYRELPCLWDRNCLAYRNKEKRHEAVTKLTALVQQHDPSATRVHVMRKLESLRACVRREYKRVKESREAAKSEDGEMYQPNLWYYHLLSFVFDGGEEDSNISNAQQSQTPKQSQIQQQSQTQQQLQMTFKNSMDEKIEITEEDNIEDHYDNSLSSYQNEYLTHSMVEMESNKRYADFEDDASKAKRHCTEVDDEYDAIGLNVAAKLRSLPTNMRIIAEKLINDVLFQAQINGLSPNSTVTTHTQDHYKQDPLGKTE